MNIVEIGMMTAVFFHQKGSRRFDAAGWPERCRGG